MQTVEVTHASPAAASALWDLLKTGSDVDKWLPFIATCELQGEGVGAKRVCTTDQGKDLIESILTIDHENRIFEYGIDSHNMDMPTKNIKGTMTVTPGADHTSVTWKLVYDLTMEMDEAGQTELKQGISELMKVGLNGLDQLVPA